MKNYKQLFNKYPISLQFLWFNLIFYMAMYLSKSVHSLWFESHGTLSNYGISYSAMALAGMFAAFIGRKLSNRNTKRVIQLGVGLYSLGMFLRIIYNSPIIAFLSGFTSGIGAAVVILLLRVWVVKIGQESDRATVVSLRKFSMDLGSSLGGLVSGLLLFLLSFFMKNGLEFLLILSSLLCLFSIRFVPDMEVEQVVDKQESSLERKSLDKKLSFGVIVFGILTGLMASLFTPYLPVILKHQGVPLSMIGISLTLMGIASTYFSSLFSGDRINQRKTFFYILAELGIALLTICFLFPFPWWMLIVLLLVRVGFTCLSSITEELMELTIFPKDKIAAFYGLSQTSFFIGDALGGLVSSGLYTLDMKWSILTFSALVVINMMLFYSFYHYMLKRNHSEEDLAREIF